jgi:hypothetical protein
VADGFGALCAQCLDLYWIEDTGSGVSHSEILRRMGWEENNDVYVRFFVRIEIPGYLPRRFKFDESSTLPGWTENNLDEIKDKALKTLDKVVKVREEWLPKMDKIVSDRIAAMMQGDSLIDRILNEQTRVAVDQEYRLMREDYIKALSMIKGYVPDNERIRR